MDEITSTHVLGSDNNLHTVGDAGSHVKILGDGNTVNGADSGWNVITGHNATVEGTGNFVAGGNETEGASVTGDNDIVIGAGASATGDDIIALGNNAVVAGANAVAIGRDTQASGIRATAIGSNASGAGDNATAIGTSSNAQGASAFALGTRASATALRTTAIGTDATASDVNATAIGFDANADGRLTVAIGSQATALGNNSLAIGRQSRTEDTHTNSAAIGFGATTTFANQIVLGTGTVTYTLPGITSNLSQNRQTGAVYFVTSDSQGNLATTDEPVPPSGGNNISAPSSPAAPTSSSSETPPPAPSGNTDEAPVAPVATREPTSTANASPETNSALTTDESSVSLTASNPNTPNSAAPTEVQGDMIGTNLVSSSAPASQTIPASNIVAASIDSETLAQVTVNTDAIEVNRQEIARNSVLIDQAFEQIGNNADDIAANSRSIGDIEQGLAAVAALPDMYLNPDENWSAAGGLSTIGGEVGFGATLALRGTENWSFGASVGVGGDEAAGKIQFRYGGK